MKQLKDNEEQTRKAEYSLRNFLKDCKERKSKVNIDFRAQNEAANLFNLTYETNIKNQILEIIGSYKECDFTYINTKAFRNGINGNHPLVDAYNFEYHFAEAYISFCFLETTNGWFIKSLHSDNSHNGNASTITIAELCGIKDFMGGSKNENMSNLSE